MSITNLPGPHGDGGTSIELVTVELAILWLEKYNTHNRTVSGKRVSEYANDMKAGRWHFNGESIQFDWNGIMLNGQHRLRAIVESGCPQKFVIVRGLNPAVQLTMDQGTRRSPADQLLVAGLPMSKTSAAAIRVYVRWQSERLFGDNRRVAITTSEVVEWAQCHPIELDLLHQIEGGVRSVPCQPSIALGISLKLHELDYDAAEQFMATVCKGAGDAESPVLAASQSAQQGGSGRSQVDRERCHCVLRHSMECRG